MGPYFESLLHQTYKNFEVIIIDDCSTDDSYKHLMTYKENSGMDIVLLKTKRNSGPGLARNLGLEKVIGKYVIFIDSDDYIDCHCLAEVSDTILNTGADCVMFDYYKKKGKNIIYGSTIPGFAQGAINQKLAIANATGSMCCKVYRTENIKLNGVRFPDILRFEDMVFNKRSLEYCNNIHYIKKPLYYYISNESSIVNNKKNASEKYAIEAFQILEGELKNEFPNEIETIFIREMLYSTVLTLVSNGARREEIINHIKICEGNYPNWNKNDCIKNFASHQKVFLKLIQFRIIWGLRLMAFIRKTLRI
jgi:glycosyltransferase involved in cell wall biosynthesis